MKYPVLVSSEGGKYVARCLLVSSIHAEGGDLSECLKKVQEQFALKVCDETSEIIVVMDTGTHRETTDVFPGDTGAANGERV